MKIGLKDSPTSPTRKSTRDYILIAFSINLFLIAHIFGFTTRPEKHANSESPTPLSKVDPRSLIPELYLYKSHSP